MGAVAIAAFRDPIHVIVGLAAGAVPRSRPAAVVAWAISTVFLLCLITVMRDTAPPLILAGITLANTVLVFGTFTLKILISAAERRRAD